MSAMGWEPDASALPDLAIIPRCESYSCLRPWLSSRCLRCVQFRSSDPPLMVDVRTEANEMKFKGCVREFRATVTRHFVHV
jgi:hypothetical protein